MIIMNKNKFYTFLFLLTAVTVFAQQKPVQTSIDSTKIKIGSQFHLTLKTNVDTLSRVTFPESKNFGALEVLESYPVDTLKKDVRYELIKRYGLTQFDSGRYVIPSLPVVINNKSFQTDSLYIEVANITVDTLKQPMFDIKPIIPGESGIGNWWKYLLVIIVIVAIAFLIYWYIKKYKKEKAKEIVYATPIEKATAHLKDLEKKDFLEQGEIKTYYSELTDIVRTYIEEAIQIPAMESTTAELLEALRKTVVQKKMNLSRETFEQLEKVLKNADLVKFAKSKPLDFEIAEDRNRIEKTIVVIDKSIPKEVEEDIDYTEIGKANQLKKKKKKRITIAVLSIVLAFLLIGIYIGFTKGFGYLQDNIIGHPTKELLEGEWVKSEYGNPGVNIETPKVLKRLDISTMVSKEMLAAVKDMQMFGYGAMYDDFFVLVGTNKYPSAVDIDLNMALDGNIKMWEAQGAQNILVKQEEFQTPEGITGLRAYGTFSVINSDLKKSTKLYYEVLFFKQDQGLQQILIMQKEADEYANEILERIKSSVEFRKVNN